MRDGGRRALPPAIAATFLAGLVASAALSTTARHADLADPNDTRGLLDVRRVQLSHRAQGAVWRMVTFQTWTVPGIWDRGFVFVYLDTRWGEVPEHYVLISSDGGSLHGELFRDRPSGADRALGPVPVWRRDGRSVSVSVRFADLVIGAARDFYAWHVVTLFTSDVCPQVCIDRAPDAGASVQYFPGASPSPSPSPTPSPTG